MTIRPEFLSHLDSPVMDPIYGVELDRLSSNPERGSKQLLAVQNSLIAEGRYDILSSPEYRSRIDSITKKYGRAKQRRIKGDLAYSWLADQENFIENRNGDNKRNTVSGMPRWKFDKYQTAEYATAQMNMIFGKIAQFQRTSDITILHEIEQSQLIQGSEGLLSLKKPSELDDKSIQNSPIQQGRMFLLGIRGLSAVHAEKIVDYVKLPPNTSRSITGKLPAAIIRMGARLGLDWSDKAHTGWPTPQDGGGAPLPHKDNILVYESAVNVRIKHLEYCIKSGLELPDLKAYLPKEVLGDRQIMRSLVETRKAYRKIKPVSRWNKPHVRGEDNIVYSNTGSVVGHVNGQAVDRINSTSGEKPSTARSKFRRSIWVMALLGFLN